MAFLDKLGETISTKGKDVAKRAKELAEVASLNAKINTQEEIIRKAYIEIGQKYYEKNKLDTTNEFGSEFEIISESMDEITKIKKEIQIIKNYKVCSKCGAEAPAEALYCSVCGAQFQIVEGNAKESDETNDNIYEEESIHSETKDKID
ncbi:hypothetical protein C8E03_101269 [Lachnotalea glycerini]|uniref:Zinc-ribbon domain-containing protein n=1 Tax=Lachnotalea glycerini TaxID=1763509 RepID=A0A318ERN7_9FIRM|nr:zinc ribbon domain-containing protein [Lachnotalea glycerini]PXV95639.1 hypothetical protein C8E03_101269 [Lachnotalea glycerini]